LQLIQMTGQVSSHWGQVPPSAAVERVRVGEFEGEYVRGYFVIKPGASGAVWDPEAHVRRLCWREGGLLFELRLGGRVAPVEYLERDTLIALAESLVYRPVVAEERRRPDYLRSVADAETLAGFDVLEPTILPEGFVFEYATYDARTRMVRLSYSAPTGPGTAAVVLFQTPQDNVDAKEPLEGFPQDEIEMVQVGEACGYYAEGVGMVVFEGTQTPGTATPTAVWQPDDPQRTLTWTVDGLAIRLHFFTSQWYGGRLDKAAMIELAESLR
jgi:hypothetical protein